MVRRLLVLRIRLWLWVRLLIARRCWLWRGVIGSLGILRTRLLELVNPRVVEHEKRHIIPESCRSINSVDRRFVEAEDSRDHGLEEV